jgi:hypothetical protein
MAGIVAGGGVGGVGRYVTAISAGHQLTELEFLKILRGLGTE